MLVKSVSPGTGNAAITLTYEYDAFGRQSKYTDRRGNHVTNFIAGSPLAGNIDFAGPGYTNYAYGPSGRVEEITQPIDASSNVKTYTDYDTLGRVTKRWGSATYPVEYEYDADPHRFVTLPSYRDVK